MKLIFAMTMLATALLGADLSQSGVAQPAERPTLDRKVAGSIPATRATSLAEASKWRSERSYATDTTTTTLPIQTTTTTTTLPGISEATYPEWWAVAVDAGWPVELLPTLDIVMYRESRGQPDVIGAGSWGLLQLQWSAHKTWMGDHVTSREELLDPYTNLHLGWLLYQIADEWYGCGWQPWYMSLGDPYIYC